jgi:peptide-methionine (S)-S-oxide reductase
MSLNIEILRGRNWYAGLALVVLLAAAAGYSVMARGKSSETGVPFPEIERAGDGSIASGTPLAEERPDDSQERVMATFGSGCFWCTEAIFQNLKGVETAVSGYSGGRVPDPTYRAVCSGTTGHAEVIQVKYDPKVISYEELLEVFWRTHDPTTLNRQGNDVGTQYRSVVFYHDAEQQRTAEEYKNRLNDAGVFHDPIVTEISPYRDFYAAENYHQDYFELNGREPYCSLVIRPKLEKFKKVFGDKVKPEANQGR